MPRGKDTFNGGTWFLSYLCEIGLINNADTVQDNYLEGTLLQNCWGLQKGVLVYIEMNTPDTLQIWYCNPKDEGKFMDEATDGCWRNHPKAGKLTKTIHLEYL